MTRTETALRALRAALDASADLPEVRRNAPFDTLVAELAGEPTIGIALVLVDGQGSVTNEFFGDGDGSFEIEHRAEIEWVAVGPEGDDLEAVFDAGLAAIAAALSIDRTLSGAVNSSRIATPPERDVEALGARVAKTARIVVSLEFTSPNPF